MSDPYKKVECAEHGVQSATFVCRHLAKSSIDGEVVGYHCSLENPDAPYPDAWCDTCERVRLEEGGDWNDRSEDFAGITLLCSSCCSRSRKINQAG